MVEEEDTQLRLEEFRLRLDRRNTLLDVIRKAYHRDILVIREYLVQLKAGTSVKSILLGDPELKSIPSIDLREKGLYLFAPEECELRLQPCFHCGGHLEIVHRESSRISSLTKSCNDLNDEVNDLKTKVSDITSQLKDKDESFAILQEKYDIDHRKYAEEVSGLRGRLVDFEKLYETYQSLKNENFTLKSIRQEKEEAVNLLVTAKSNLFVIGKDNSDFRLAIERKDEIASRHKLEYRIVVERKNQLEEIVRDLEIENDELKGNSTDMGGRLLCLQKELDNINVESSRLSGILKESKNSEIDLACLLRKSTEEKEQISSKMEETRHITDRIIEEVRAKLKNKTEEFNDVRGQLDNTLEMHNSAIKDIKDGRVAFVECQEQLMSSCDTVEVLSTLTSSYIRGLYDHCMVQEKILLLAETPPPTSMKARRIPISLAGGSLGLVMERLDKKFESVNIDWDSVLMDDKDRRQIFGNLNNRMQINLNSIDRFITKIRGKYDYEMKQMGEDNTRKELDIHSAHAVQLCKLEDNQIQLEEELNKLSKQHKVTTEDLEKTKIELEITIEEKNGEIVDIETQLSDRSDLHVDRDVLREQLHKTQQTLIETKDNLKRSGMDVADRDSAIDQLEKILKNSTSRYALLMEGNRIRLETNTHMGIQASPSIHSIGQQVNFISTSTTRPGV